MLNWGHGAQTVVRRPRVLVNRLRMVAYHPSVRRRRERWLRRLTGASEAQVRTFVAEIGHDRLFLRDLRAAFGRHTAYLPLPTDFMVEPSAGGSMFFHLVSLYALIRIARPHTVVETGGTPGKSSAFILRAMERNGIGELYTIDLPPSEAQAGPIAPSEAGVALPRGLSANWCVPEALRTRQHLMLGPAQEHLPPLLRRLGSIDIFIHDSDHSHGHMMWEFRTAYPFIRSGGYLWSDDILTNTAWREFCAEIGRHRGEFISQGVVRKPALA
jgi:Methyltransferase domain